MTDFNYRNRFTDYLARIIVLAINKKIHFEVITDKLSSSSFLKEIENDDHSLIMNYSVEELFELIFSLKANTVSLMNYNDAYWCGYVYSNIFYKTNKTFPYIF